MDKKEFGYHLKDAVDNLLYSNDIDAKTMLKEIEKDNGVKHNAILSGADIGGMYVSIYYDEYYDMYVREDISFEEAAQEVCDIYKAHIDKVQEISNGILAEIHDWEYVKDKISLVLLNSELNREYLKDMPNKTPEGMKDLSIIYKVNLPDDMSIKVNNFLLARWDISVAELHEAAMKNAEKIVQPSVKSMQDIFREIYNEVKEQVGDNISDIFEDYIINTEQPEMYVITNKNKTEGAGVVLLETVQKKLNELAKGRELFIIPSSKHEVLAIPDNKMLAIEEIKNMVQEVNHTEVSAADILSNNVYKYNPATMEIRTLTNKPIIEERQHKINR